MIYSLEFLMSAVDLRQYVHRALVRIPVFLCGKEEGTPGMLKPLLLYCGLLRFNARII